MINTKLFPAICACLLWQQTALKAQITTKEEYNEFFDNSNDVAITIIHMEACRAAWNYRLRSSESTDPLLMKEPIGKKYVLGKIEGLKFSYTVESAPDIDICGWYFIPDGNTPVEYLESQAHAQAINRSMPAFLVAGADVHNLILDDSGSGTGQTQLSYNTNFMAAVDEYQEHLIEEKIQHRLQDDMSFYKAFPIIGSPDIQITKGEIPASWASSFGKDGKRAWSHFLKVSEDLRNFDKF